jgi:4-amino-4-deoxy-L-arabinose transferase-like glycosyltransferase
LTKGLIGVVLPLLSLGIYSVVQRDPTPWRRLHALPGLTIFSLLTVPWFVAVSMANPEFPSFFFIHEHFARYSTGEHHRMGQFWYFVPIVLIGMLPWTVFLPRAIHESWSAKQIWAIGFAPGRFLVLWIATVFGFFSISNSKLPAYVLPLVPAVALLIGMHVSRLSRRRILRDLIPGTVMVGVGIMVASEILEIVHDSQDMFPLYESYSRWLRGGALLLVATSALIPLFVRGKSSIVVCLASASLLTTQIALTGFESLSPVYSAYETVKGLRPHLKPGTRVFNVGRYDQSLPHYLQSPVILVADADELDFGLRQEPTRWLPSLAAFKSAWSSSESAVAVMSLESYETLSMEGLPMIFLSRTGNRVAVVKP